ncbi:Uncharacterised protein [Legionella steigerwaltii]|uniref:Uncharacterized protein n=1 Tax=Legionella steigerwaltii TaxID=460 RepID=A0A378LCR4_9GAMM|nr:hypothetical protein [Legionella steigerwaltii]KTD80795.1 hypothetical protein Lstg_0022 [Legionella steigerwaltii]STY23519.1 Uncharacterised protein [Legionella steigerwaltii]
MGANEKHKKEKNSSGGWFYSIFNGQTNSGSYCTPDQCFINNQQAFSSTNLIPPVNSHPLELNNPDQMSHLAESINLSELFPPELRQLIYDAAQQGLLLSMLITLANEGATDYLKHLHYHPDKIYWINQGIRTLLLIAMGSSATTAIGTALAGYALHSYWGYSKENSNYITTGVALGINLVTNPMSLIETSLAIGTSVCASFLGSKMTKSGYHFVRNTFFGSKKVEHAQENELRTEFSIVN